MAQTARVTLTLSNIATEEDLHTMEERIMSTLSDAVAELRSTVESLTLAARPERIAELEAALAAEREAATALAVQEQSEDVDQNAQLAEARATVDALLAEMNAAAGDLGTITDQLAAVGTAVDETPDETPVGEVVVPPVTDAPAAPGGEAPPSTPEDAPAPAPTEETPAGAGAPAEANPTPTADPSSPATTDAPDSTAGTPAEAAPVSGLTDAAGNPVDGPNL